VEKCGRAGQVTDGDMAHANCMLGTEVYKHTLRICNTYCFSTGPLVALTPLSVKLYVHYRSYRKTNLLTYLLTYFLIYFLTYLLSYLLTYFLSYLLTFLFTYLLTYFLTYLLT
jgi:hypothetical protein